jgi:hypothetical protein
MRILTVAAIVVGIAALPAGGHAATTKKVHRAYRPVAVQTPVQSNPNQFYSGNGAASLNDANSMYGDNSAANNANGRTSGSGFR